jgi:hypothetical protein
MPRLARLDASGVQSCRLVSGDSEQISCTFPEINYKPAIFGQIVNISKHGIAARYSSNGQQPSVSSELDIFIMDSNFYIEKIQIKIISDIEIDYKPPFGSQKK